MKQKTESKLTTLARLVAVCNLHMSGEYKLEVCVGHYVQLRMINGHVSTVEYHGNIDGGIAYIAEKLSVLSPSLQCVRINVIFGATE